MNYLITYMFTGLEQEKKISASTSMKWNAKFLYCTALGFITKNEEYNPKDSDFYKYKLKTRYAHQKSFEWKIHILYNIY